jgi:serralysin
LIATIYGREGDDFNGNGNDTIRGGSGFDTVTFNRDLDAYEIDFSGDSVFVTDLVGSGGTDELMGVERIVFADGEILV